MAERFGKDYERNFRALEMRGSGMLYKEIGIAMGRADNPSVPISRERSRSIVQKAIRLLKHPTRADHPLRPLALELDGK